jgi:hypothetical protein
LTVRDPRITATRDASSSGCSAAPSGDATGQNFVKAAAIEIDDLETPTVAVKTFANITGLRS